MGDADAGDEITELVDKNGLVKLFANRARARVLVTLFYADEPVTTDRIADAAGIYQSVVHEALDPLGAFGVVEELGGEERPRYRLREDDELVAELRGVAELATERFYDEGA